MTCGARVSALAAYGILIRKTPPQTPPGSSRMPRCGKFFPSQSPAPSQSIPPIPPLPLLKHSGICSMIPPRNSLSCAGRAHVATAIRAARGASCHPSAASSHHEFSSGRGHARGSLTFLRLRGGRNCHAGLSFRFRPHLQALFTLPLWARSKSVNVWRHTLPTLRLSTVASCWLPFLSTSSWLDFAGSCCFLFDFPPFAAFDVQDVRTYRREFHRIPVRRVHNAAHFPAAAGIRSALSEEAFWIHCFARNL